MLRIRRVNHINNLNCTVSKMDPQELAEIQKRINQDYEEAYPAKIHANAPYYIFQEQRDAAVEIAYRLILGTTWVILVAQPQSGKTGVLQMLAWMRSRYNNLRNRLLDDIIDSDNIHIVTGMNCCDWKQQTIKRMMPFLPSAIDQVLHNPDIKKLLNRSGSKLNMMQKRSLIAMDESHIGSDVNSMTDQLLISIKVSPDGRDANSSSSASPPRIVSVSASPMAEVTSNRESQHKALVSLFTGSNYYSISDLLNDNRVRSSWSLKTLNDARRFLIVINEMRHHFRDGMYVLFRAVDQQQKVLETVLSENNIDSVKYDYKNRNDFSLEDLRHPPRSGSVLVVFIKQDVRASLTICTDHIGIAFDTPSSASDTVAQSFAGRLVGYNKNLQRRSLVFCDKARLEQYAKWADHHFSAYQTPIKAKNMAGHRVTYEPSVPLWYRAPDDIVQTLVRYENNTNRMFNWLESKEDFDTEFYPRKQLDTVMVMKPTTAASTIRSHFDRPLKHYGCNQPCSGTGRENTWEVSVDARAGSKTYGVSLITRSGARQRDLPDTKGMRAKDGASRKRGKYEMFISSSDD